MISIKDGIKMITGKLFRLVYMGNQHIETIEGTAKSKTWTKQEVEEFTNEKQANNRIEELGLTLVDNTVKQQWAKNSNS